MKLHIYSILTIPLGLQPLSCSLLDTFCIYIVWLIHQRKVQDWSSFWGERLTISMHTFTTCSSSQAWIKLMSWELVSLTHWGNDWLVLNVGGFLFQVIRGSLFNLAKLWYLPEIRGPISFPKRYLLGVQVGSWGRYNLTRFSDNPIHHWLANILCSHLI